MEIMKIKEVTLYNIFCRYLISFCVLTFLSILLPLVILSMIINTGLILPANYAQNNIEELRNEIIKDGRFNENKIKHPYKYGLYNGDFEILSSNFNEKQLSESYNYLKGENFKTNYIYTKVNLEDEICIISYDIRAHFLSEKLNDIIPYPELIEIIFSFFLFFISSIMLVRNFGKKLKKELKPLKKSMELIINKDLDFEIMTTNIKEFNDVLESIDSMKEALKKSLEIQWKSEEKKKMQIAALAHDIKTPLTIIKGNAELLSESDFSLDDKECIDYIISNTDKIEQYTSLLIDISKTESDIEYEIEKVEFNDFLQNLMDEINMLCKKRNIKKVIKVDNPPSSFKANRILLMRALTNIIINAVDYSRQEGTIEVTIRSSNNKLIFTVKDCGIGFTKEGLKNATSQFYMEDRERKVGKHYGIGLYIAETIAKKHGGEVVLKNREEIQGAEVSLIMKIT